MIERSDRIVVTEHSFQYDAYDTDSGKSLIPDEVVYGNRQLDPKQVNLFLSTIKQLDPETQDVFLACIFAQHHTVRFYAGGKLKSSMKICFQCNQVKWDAVRTTFPQSPYPGLATFVKSIGLQSDRDWTALAKQHVK